MSEPVVAMCQDCLRLLDVGDLVPGRYPPGLCPHCGGQTCSCDGCLDTAMDLMRGNFLAKRLRKPIAGWSLKDGVARAKMVVPGGKSRLPSGGDAQAIDPAGGDANS